MKCFRYFSDDPVTILPATASSLPGRPRRLTSTLTLTLTRQIFNRSLICETTQKLLPGETQMFDRPNLKPPWFHAKPKLLLCVFSAYSFISFNYQIRFFLLSFVFVQIFLVFCLSFIKVSLFCQVVVPTRTCLCRCASVPSIFGFSAPTQISKPAIGESWLAGQIRQILLGKSNGPCNQIPRLGWVKFYTSCENFATFFFLSRDTMYVVYNLLLHNISTFVCIHV